MRGTSSRVISIGGGRGSGSASTSGAIDVDQKNEARRELRRFGECGWEGEEDGSDGDRGGEYAVLSPPLLCFAPIVLLFDSWI